MACEAPCDLGWVIRELILLSLVAIEYLQYVNEYLLTIFYLWRGGIPLYPLRLGIIKHLGVQRETDIGLKDGYFPLICL